MTGMIEWGKNYTPPPPKKIARTLNKTPKKSLDQNVTPSADFPSHQIFPESVKKPKKKYLPTFSFPKKKRNQNFQTQKILRSSLSLEIRSDPPPGVGALWSPSQPLWPESPNAPRGSRGDGARRVTSYRPSLGSEN